METYACTHCTLHILDVKDPNKIVTYATRILKRTSFLVIFWRGATSQPNPFLEIFEKITNVVWLEEHGENMFKMMRKMTEFDEKISFVDLWNGHRFVKNSPIFPPPTIDLRGRVLKANTFHFPPYTYKTEEGYAGVEHAVISAIADKLNFKMDISPPADGQWWGDFVNGSYTGLVGQLASRKVRNSACKDW